MGDNAMERIEMEENENMTGECLPIEEYEEAEEDHVTEESAKIRVLPSPNPPSRQEALEHNCTHIPFSQLVSALREREEQSQSPQSRCWNVWVRNSSGEF